MPGVFFPYLCSISFPTCYRPKGFFCQVLFYNHLGDLEAETSVVVSLSFHKLQPFPSAQRMESVKLGSLKGCIIVLR